MLSIRGVFAFIALENQESRCPLKREHFVKEFSFETNQRFSRDMFSCLTDFLAAQRRFDQDLAESQQQFMYLEVGV